MSLRKFTSLVLTFLIISFMSKCWWSVCFSLSINDLQQLNFIWLFINYYSFKDILILQLKCTSDKLSFFNKSDLFGHSNAVFEEFSSLEAGSHLCCSTTHTHRGHCISYLHYGTHNTFLNIYFFYSGNLW
jgi:hypothetical protein